MADLGTMPLANRFLPHDKLGEDEPRYPLHARVCSSCFLVQVDNFISPQTMFGEYAYFSSYSDSWLTHASDYVNMIVPRLGLGPASRVVEIASNDGYLLQYFMRHGIPVSGIEPAANVARVAQSAGIPTITRFFGTQLAGELVSGGMQADLLIGNNVLAHVPDINDFVAGMRMLLKRNGAITLEFPHLLNMMKGGQFDTIYHEHFSYFSLASVERILARHGLAVFDVEELPTHGGSLRIYAGHAAAVLEIRPSVERLRQIECEARLENLDTYAPFSGNAAAAKRSLLDFLGECKQKNKKVVAYGAAAKGNTLLNFCGIGTDLIEYAVDRSPHKQGLYLPGSRIRIHPPGHVGMTRPDFLLILPWNLRDEVVAQMSGIREWGGRFVVPIPRTEVLP